MHLPTADTLKSKPVISTPNNQILPIAEILPAVAGMLCDVFCPVVLISEYTTFSGSATSVHTQKAKGSLN